MRENPKIVDRDTGKVYYHHRSLAVTGIITAVDDKNKEVYVLLERRGSGCPDNVGKLCCVCGYIGWDETRRDALIRETYEETGLTIDNKQIFELCTIDDPSRDARQNIVTRYLVECKYSKIKRALDNGTINTKTKSRGGEKDEVSEFLLLTYFEISEMSSDEFAFGHREMILEVLESEF